MLYLAISYIVRKNICSKCYTFSEALKIITVIWSTYLFSLTQPVICTSSQGCGQTCLAQQVTPSLQMELLFSSSCQHTPAAGSRPSAMLAPGCRDSALTWRLSEGLTPAASLHTPRGTPWARVHKASKCPNVCKTHCKLSLDTPPGQIAAARVHSYFTVH